MFKERHNLPIEEGFWKGLGLGALGTAAYLTHSDDGVETLQNWHELDQKDQLWNHFMDKGQQGLEYLKTSDAPQTSTLHSTSTSLNSMDLFKNQKSVDNYINDLNNSKLEFGSGLTNKDMSSFNKVYGAENIDNQPIYSSHDSEIESKSITTHSKDNNGTSGLNKLKNIASENNSPTKPRLDVQNMNSDHVGVHPTAIGSAKGPTGENGASPTFTSVMHEKDAENAENAKNNFQQRHTQ